MFASINLWNLSINEYSIQEYLLLYFENLKKNSPTHLLNIDKIIANPNCHIIEKLVYDIAMFHFKRLNIEYNHNIHCIEFWFKNTLDKNNLHIDCDEYDKKKNNPVELKSPLLSCITYFNENNQPTIITNIKKYEFDNKLIYDNHSIFLSFPKFLKHISFDGGKYYHGACDIFNNSSNERYILAINLWDKYPENVPYFLPVNAKDNIIIDIEDSIFELTLCNKSLKNLEFPINKDFLTDLISNNECDLSFVKDILLENGIENHDNFLFIKPEKNIDFIVITVATENNFELNRFTTSLNNYNIDHIILGLGLVWTGGDITNGPGGGQKINLLKYELSKWAKNKLESTIVLFSDSYDVVNLSSKKEILDKYLKFGINTIVFSAEKTCWPNNNLSHFYPNTSSQYKYLNSGGFIGKANNILNLINEKNINDIDDDQLFYTNSFLMSKNNSIILDYYTEIFQTLNNSLNDIRMDYDNNRLSNIINKNTPCFIHGNGHKVIKDYLIKLNHIVFNNNIFIERKYFFFN